MVLDMSNKGGKVVAVDTRKVSKSAVEMFFLAPYKPTTVSVFLSNQLREKQNPFKES